MTFRVSRQAAQKREREREKKKKKRREREREREEEEKHGATALVKATAATTPSATRAPTRVLRHRRR